MGITAFTFDRLSAVQFFQQQLFIGEVFGLFFRIDQSPINNDFEDAAAGRNQLDIGGEALMQFGRQTDGAWPVVSLRAVFDGDFHGCSMVAGEDDAGFCSPDQYWTLRDIFQGRAQRKGRQII